MKETKANQLYIILIVVLGIMVFIAPDVLSQTGEAVNYRNVSVRSTVNITNSFPEVLSVTLVNPITLSAGRNLSVACNATIRDFDGVGEINVVNATFFDVNNATYLSPDDNNNHYTNASCTRVSNDSITANYTCGFDVLYYANNGTNWNCTVIAQDTPNNTTGNNTNSTEISQLIALNVTAGTGAVIDFGNMAVGDISTSSVEANVTNFGNVRINVTVRGYGAVEGDNLSMSCEQNNISMTEERFSANASLPWAQMTPMSNLSQYINNISIEARVNDTVGGETFNNTYWRLRVPLSTNPGGECNGTVIFQAELMP